MQTPCIYHMYGSKLSERKFCNQDVLRMEFSQVTNSMEFVSQHCMEPEGSIPNSQVLSACPYPEPDTSSLHHPIPPLQDPS
jgi:hypothetical protein